MSGEKTVFAGAVNDEGIAEVVSVMHGATEEVIPTDGGSDEKTSEMNCTDLERMLIGGVLEKMLAGTTRWGCDRSRRNRVNAWTTE